MKTKNGFTLAEVLITLGIIGIVAAMTIPTLMANNQKAQYVTALKKAYTQFNQVLVQIATDKGCVGDLRCTGLFEASTTNRSLGDELVKYFKVVKNCETTAGGGPSITGCLSRISDNYDGSSARGDGDSTSYYRFITADGTGFLISNMQNNCTLNYSTNKTYNTTQVCGAINVDVNGRKGPNNKGMDVFVFYITNGKGPMLYPTGGVDDGCTSSWCGYWQDSSGNPRTCYPGNKLGETCAGRIIEEGWEMNY